MGHPPPPPPPPARAPPTPPLFASSRFQRFRFFCGYACPDFCPCLFSCFGFLLYHFFRFAGRLPLVCWSVLPCCLSFGRVDLCLTAAGRSAPCLVICIRILSQTLKINLHLNVLKGGMFHGCGCGGRVKFVLHFVRFVCRCLSAVRVASGRVAARGGGRCGGDVVMT